jgi:hypothetical protein
MVHRFSRPSSGDIICLFTSAYGSLRHARSQLLSEADLLEKHGCPNPFLPNHWSRHVKSALLHVISLRGSPVSTRERRPPEALTCASARKEIKAKRGRSHHLVAIGLRARICHLVVADNTRRSPRRPRTEFSGRTTLPKPNLLCMAACCYNIALYNRTCTKQPPTMG